MFTIQHCKTTLAITAMLAATGSFAATMSQPDYAAAKDRIGADYKTDQAACANFSGNANDICLEQAKGKNKVALAELEASYSGKVSDADKVAVAKADAAYAVAKEMCDDKGGNAKNVCVAESKAAHTKALADAKLNKTVGEATKDAVDDKRDADYKVAAEKCDALAGDAKTACISDAKLRFHKS